MKPHFEVFYYGTLFHNSAHKVTVLTIFTKGFNFLKKCSGCEFIVLTWTVCPRSTKTSKKVMSILEILIFFY